MVHEIAEELTRTVDRVARELRTLSDTVASAKPRPEAWSIKEIVGHLIDSAANNHQRFIRAQQSADLVFPGYEQRAWVAAQDYQRRPWLELIDFWALYNRHLAHTIECIPESAVDVRCRIGSESITLRFLLEDYLRHLQHHLKQIRERTPA